MPTHSKQVTDETADARETGADETMNPESEAKEPETELEARSETATEEAILSDEAESEVGVAPAAEANDGNPGLRGAEDARETPAPSRRHSAPQANTPAPRRPTALLRTHGLRFVNKMRNVGWLAGFVFPVDDQSFLLQQTNNAEQGFRIDVSASHARMARAAGVPISVMVHVRGYRNADGPQVALHGIKVDKPSLLDLPAKDVWAAGFGHGAEAATILRRLAKSSFSPFDAEGNIRPEYVKYIRSANAEERNFEITEEAEQYLRAYKVFGDIVEASSSVIDSRLGRRQNYVSVAGIVDSKAWIPATEHRKAYALIMIRQHEDQDKNIPVRVVGRTAAAFYKRVHEGSAVLAEGHARRKVIPNDDGEIASRHTYIETEELRLPQMNRDILLPIPEWWGTIRDRLVARRAEREAAKAAAKEVSAQEDKLSAGEIDALGADL